MRSKLPQEDLGSKWRPFLARLLLSVGALSGILHTATIIIKYRLSYLKVSLGQITYRTLIVRSYVGAQPSLLTGLEDYF